MNNQYRVTVGRINSYTLNFSSLAQAVWYSDKWANRGLYTLVEHYNEGTGQWETVT